MGTGYTRNDTPNNIADGNVINASDLDGEFDSIQAAFNETTGHSHDGTSGEGPQIGTGGIADSAVTTAKILDGNVTNAKLAADAVTGAKLADSAVDSEHYTNGSIDTAHIGNLQVTTAKIAADAIDGTKLADNAVDSEHYTDGSIDRVHLAADIIDGTKIADDVINSEHYIDGSIDRVHLAADIIDGTKIADDVINSEHYVEGSIDAEHLASSSVTAVKIANDAVALGTKTTGNYVATITAGTGISGSSSSEGGTPTIALAPAGAGAATYGSTSDDTKIDTITLDAYGRVTAVATGATGDIQGVTAGTNLTGGGTSGTVTINMATGGAGAATYGSTDDGTKIDTITLDAYGRVTAVATGATMDRWVLEDGDGTEVTITRDNEVKFVEGGGVDINWTDVSPGSDSDPYDLTFTINTSVIAGNGLTGGGQLNASRTLNVGAGTGIDVAADSISVDVSDFMSNGSNNRIITATGADAMNAESNMTFDGSTLNVSGSAYITGNIGRDTTDYISFSDNAHMNIHVNGSNEFRFEADGDFHADGDIIAFSTTVSDERLKTDIEKIENATDKVNQLNGYTFTYKADGKKSAGVIAQEVEKVLPSAVSEKELPLKTDDGVAYKTVQYDQIIGLLIESIKELKQEINELKRG